MDLSTTTERLNVRQLIRNPFRIATMDDGSRWASDGFAFVPVRERTCLPRERETVAVLDATRELLDSYGDQFVRIDENGHVHIVEAPNGGLRAATVRHLVELLTAPERPWYALETYGVQKGFGQSDLNLWTFRGPDGALAMVSERLGYAMPSCDPHAGIERSVYEMSYVGDGKAVRVAHYSRRGVTGVGAYMSAL